jgi:chemotaxis protein histidine kinase CheA
LAKAPVQSTGSSASASLAAAIQIQLEKLLNALEKSEKAITAKMQEMGMAPFTGPILQAWREEVSKTFTKEAKRMAKELDTIVNAEIARQDPATKIREAEERLAQATKQFEAAKTASESGASAAPQLVQEADQKAAFTELHQEVESLKTQLQVREEELNRLYNLTESDPKYQAYHVIRDLAPNWVDVAHVGRSLGIPAVRAKRLLEEFEANGLVEIDGKRARALQLIRKADTTRTKE